MLNHTALMAGGLFEVPYAQIAYWDGVQWNSVGGGMDAGILAITRWHNGDVVAGGNFSTAGGLQSPDVAVGPMRTVGDLDGAGSTDLAGLSTPLASFGVGSGASGSGDDVSGVGTVALTDLAVELSWFDVACPQV